MRIDRNSFCRRRTSARNCATWAAPQARWRSYKSRAGVVEWIARDAGAASVDIDPALQLLLSTSGTTGSQKYVRLSRDAIVANAGQIAEALAIDEHSIGIAHLPLHYSYGLSVVTSHLAAGGRVYLVNEFDHLAELLVEDRQRRRIAFPRRPLSLCRTGAPGREPCPGFGQGVHPGRRGARSSHSGEDP